MFEPLNKLETLLIGCNRGITNIDFLLSHKDTLKELVLYGCSIDNTSTGILKQLSNLKILGISSTYITDYSFMNSLEYLTNNSIRFAEAGGFGFKTTTSKTITDDAVPYAQTTYVIDNPIINIDGTYVAPVESDEYTYDTATNKITFDISNLRARESADYIVKYDFVINTRAGYDISMAPSVYVKLTKAAQLNPATITVQPKAFKCLEGSSKTLSVTATGSGTLTYQWYKDDEVLTGQTASSITFSNISESDSGKYKVVVANSEGSDTSDEVEVIVMPKLRITTQPSALTLTEGGNGELSVAAKGYGNLKYQWYKGGNAIANATSPTLQLTNVAQSAAGSYYVKVSDDNGDVTSSQVNIIVNAKPTQPEQPTTVEATTPEQPTTVEATTPQQPTTAEVTTPEQPTTVEATTAQQPTTVEATTAQQPTTAEVTTAQQPTTVEATTVQQSTTALETQASTEVISDTSSENVQEEPATGDTMPVVLYGTVLLVSMLGIAVMLAMGKKKTH